MQPVLLAQRLPDGGAHIVFDAADHGATLLCQDTLAPSPDGRLIAFAVTSAGRRCRVAPCTERRYRRAIPDFSQVDPAARELGAGWEWVLLPPQSERLRSGW
jgi:hypothetical protein